MRLFSLLSISVLVSFATSSAQLNGTCPTFPPGDLSVPTTLVHRGYQNNERCAWVVRTTSPHILITISAFDTEMGYDGLKIHDGGLANSPIVANVQGHLPSTTPIQMIVMNNVALLEFYSDRSYARDGFVLSFQGTTASNTSINTDVCFLGSVTCDSNAQCYPGSGSGFTCSCNYGYSGNGFTCTYTNYYSGSGGGYYYDDYYDGNDGNDGDNHGPRALAVAGIVLGAIGCIAFAGTAIGLFVWCHLKKQPVRQQQPQVIQLAQFPVGGAVLGQPVQYAGTMPGQAMTYAGGPSAPVLMGQPVVVPPPSAPPSGLPAASAPPPSQRQEEEGGGPGEGGGAAAAEGRGAASVAAQGKVVS